MTHKRHCCNTCLRAALVLQVMHPRLLFLGHMLHCLLLLRYWQHLLPGAPLQLHLRLAHPAQQVWLDHAPSQGADSSRFQ